MVLLNVDGLFSLIIIFYLLAHLPAIILLIIGLVRLKKKPENARKLIIIAIFYFVAGAGICGAMLT